MPLCSLGTGTQTEVQSGATAFPGTPSSLGWGGAGLEPGPLEWCSRPSPSTRPRPGARPLAPERAGRALWRRRPMSGARPRTARAARKGVCARASGLAPRGARSARKPQRAREQEVLGARSRSARPRAAPPSSPLPPARAPRLSCTSFACRQSSRVCARGRRRGRSVGGGGGEGALPLGGARGTAPPLGADASSPAPVAVGPAPRGTKGRAGS